MERLLLNDVTDSFATTLLQHLKLTSVFRQHTNSFDLPQQKRIRMLQTVLHEWDGQFRADSPEATVFTLWLSNVVQLMFSGLDESLVRRMMDTDEFLDAFMRITQQVVKMPY